ncbi:MAG: aminodeoxychorismate synthase component I [bacterium]|nr:aminodeoxychorismate synthase component I [bacterium]
MSFAAGSEPFVLESVVGGSPGGRFTIMGCDPCARIEVGRDTSLPINELANAAARVPSCPTPAEVPFVGGWVGYISYEAGLGIEAIRPTTRPDIDLPTLRFGLYDTAAVYDHAAGCWYAVGVEWPSGVFPKRPPLAERLDRVRRWLESARPPGPLAWDQPPCPGPVPNMSRQDYLRRVGRILRYIEAGDVYQVNLTQRLTTTTSADATILYRRLRRANPAGYAALLSWDDRAVISSSPELFLDLRDGEVLTRPIKGTRPRADDTDEDNRRRRELLASPKDRAELTMIVDLLRNDLGRVCAFGTVQVANPAELETHPTVHHLVGTIEGRLRPECNWADLLRASFPGGSITGAPKVRAMQIIDELEPTCRSVYCGSIGYLGLDGSLCLNIAIRTMVLEAGRLHLFAGGGIVADSDPQAEYDECMAKASGMLRALGHTSIAKRNSEPYPRAIDPSVGADSRPATDTRTNQPDRRPESEALLEPLTETRP